MEIKEHYKKLVLLVGGFIIFGAFIILSSCRKDDVYPGIDIISPETNSLFSGIDTIDIKCVVSDDNVVKNVTFTLKDASDIFVGFSKSIEINSRNFFVHDFLIINDKYLSSGEYFLEIDAFDGSNTTREHVKIYISEVEREFYFPIVVTGNTEVCDIYKIDNTTEKIISFSEEFSDADINLFNGQLGILTKSGVLNSIDPISGELIWQKDNLNNVLYEFDGKLKYNGEYLWAGNGQGIVTAYGSSAIVRKAASLSDSSFIPGFLCFGIDRFYITSRMFSGYENRLETFVSQTSSFEQFINLNSDPIGLFSVNENSVLVFSNAGSDGIIKEYVPTYNLFHDMEEIQGKKILSAVQVTSDVFLFCSTDGLLYKYNFGTFSINSLGSYNASSVYYDNWNNLLCLSAGSFITVYQYPQMIVQQIYSFDFPVKKILFYYNK